MRTIKASEVRKGMRVRVEHQSEGVTWTVEGEVRGASAPGMTAWLTFADGNSRTYLSDHPVTVLAEPEPEWVEGAWYWVSHRAVMENRVMRRVTRGWSISSSHDLADYSDSEVTVLGRVLIVDWPGDDVARDVERHGTSAPIRFVSALLKKVADAIRTQGGAR